MPNTERNENQPGQNKQTGSTQPANQSMHNQPGKDAQKQSSQPSHSGTGSKS